jgi:hypothetical protein
MHLSKFAFVQSATFGHCFAMMLVHLVRPTSWKHWPMSLNSNGPLTFWVSKSQINIFDWKSRSVYARKYSAPNQAWLGKTWPVISLTPFLKDILIRSRCFMPYLIRLSGVSLAPKDVQQVYQLKWGRFCALIRSDIVTIFTCLDLDHEWVLIAYLQLNCDGLLTSANNYYNSFGRSSRRAHRWLECGVKSNTQKLSMLQ